MTNEIKLDNAKKIAERIGGVYYNRARKEWLTEEIAYEYRNRARERKRDGDPELGDWPDLRIELQERCGLTELEALSILNDLNIEEYVDYYDHIRRKQPWPHELEAVGGDIELIRRLMRELFE